MAITPSALNRRLLALEAEIDAPLFERTARGVRLSSAGELFVHHARRQMAEMDAVRAAIEDMKGARRGRVAVAFDRSLSPAALAARIAAYRDEHPGVTFDVVPCDRGTAAGLLESYTADIAVTVEPERAGTFVTLATAPVDLIALVAEGHDLAGRGSIRLHEAMAYPLALPPEGTSARFLADLAAARQDQRLAPTVVGPEGVTLPIVRAGAAVGVGLRLPATDDGREAWERPAMMGVVAVPFLAADVGTALAHLGQLRDRALPVPAGRFANAIRTAIARANGEV